MDRESGGGWIDGSTRGVGERDMTALSIESSRPALPVIRRAEQRVAAGLSVDRVVVHGDFLAMSGWAIGSQDLTFAVVAGGVSMVPSLTFFARDDVAAGYGISRDLAKGFLAVWRNRPRGGMQVRLNAVDGQPLEIVLTPREESSPADLVEFLRENSTRARFLFEGLVHNPAAIVTLLNHLEEPPAAFNRARGYIEHARGIEGVGGLVIGWTVVEPDVRLRLVDERGAVVALDGAARWTRHDIVEAMSRDFGDYVFNAGFLQGWGGALSMGGKMRLIASSEEASYSLAEAKWTTAPLDPVSFARWSFEIPTPRESFAQRLASHDGAIIDALIERKINRRGKMAPTVHDYGRRTGRPKCAVVVPLYGRHDFMLDQLLAVSDDPDFLSTAELVYVIDDHRLVSALAAEAPVFEASFGVPFRTVWSGENRGYAGATNLGVANSSAPFVLLLNSDVIPVATGWLEKMRSILVANPDIGVLGARLHHPNGAIQHDGMGFEWDATLRLYLNKHPGSGFSGAPPRGKFVKCQAVTGACALMRREVYEAVGGLDEKYLIGDFEDSDLCLKVREKGLEIACLPLPMTLVHLERQSFRHVGAPNFRDYVVRYNAWRHQSRWGASISKLCAVDKQRTNSK
jgi:GT2 family glycosyltransferase